MNSVTKTSGRITVISSLRLALVAVGVLLAAGAASAQDKVRVTSSTITLAYVPFYMAQTLGYFDKLGLKVEEVKSDSGPKSLAAVISDNADILLGATTTPVAARKQGADIVLFAPIFSQYSSNIIVSRKWQEKNKLTDKSSYAERLAALKGATIGITGPGSGTDQIVRYFADAAKINPDRDMTITALGGDAGILMSAFSQGRIDALSISAPTSHMAVRQFGGMILFNVGAGQVKELDGYFQTGFAARGDWLKKNEAVAVRFTKAIQMSFDALRDLAVARNASEAIRKTYFPNIEPNIYAELWQEMVVSAPKTVELDRKMIADIFDFANKFSKDKLDPALIDAVYTNEIAKKAR